MKNNNKGFSLVELIVVIAIMAILAAVAVVGFSVYIPKAQQASDKQVVGDVEYILSLAYQSGDLTKDGYIILSTSGAVVGDDNAEIIAVLQSAYGEKWNEELALQYDAWIGMTSDQAFAEAYQNSSFKGNETVLIDQLGSVTNMLTDALASNKNLVGSSFNGYLQELEEQGVDVSSNQAISNAAVLYAADTIVNSNTSAVDQAFANFYDSNNAAYGDVGALTLALKQELGTFGAVAAIYAHGEAFGQYVASNGNSELLNDFHDIDVENIDDPDAALEQVAGNLGTMVETAKTDATINPYALDYMSNSQYAKDVTAYLEAMKKIDANADKFTGNLNSEGCYTDGTAGALLQAAVAAGSLNVSCNDGEIAIWIVNGVVNNTVTGIQD